MNKKLISNSLNVLYAKIGQCHSKALTTEVSSYLMMAVAKMFRLLYSAEPHNAQSLFSVCLLYTSIDNAAASTTQWGLSTASLVLEALTAQQQATRLCLVYPAVGDVYKRQVLTSNAFPASIWTSPLKHIP